MHAFQRPLRPFALAALLGTASLAHAQSAAPIDAEKQKVIDQIVAVLHPENAIVMDARRPAAAAFQQSRVALEQKQLPKEKVDAAMNDIKTDVEKYVATVDPLVINSARKNMHGTFDPVFAQSFSTDELKQLLAFLQSPVKTKFEQVMPQASLALGKKVEADIGAEVNKDASALQQTVGTKLRAAATAAGK